MPTPDGREWFSSEKIAQIQMDRIADRLPPLSAPVLEEIKARLQASFSGLYGIEFKIGRLTEKLKDAIEAEAFGPLFVDADGNRVPPSAYNPAVHSETQAYQIWRAFKDIYTQSILDQYDEDGNLLP